MDRRSFLTRCVAASAGWAALAGSAPDATEKKGPFADAPLRISAPPGWFPGDTIEEQLEHIAAWGFPAYEWLGPTGDLDALRATMDGLGIEISCICGVGAIAPGQMVAPTQHDRLIKGFWQTVKTAQTLGCKNIVGLTGNERTDVSREEQTEYVVRCLRRLAPIAEGEGVTIVVEPLNVLIDHPGFFLTRTDQMIAILEAVDSPNVKMLFDIYHQQITEGNVIRNITNNIERIGHFHIGDNPGRCQPGSGELNYKNIFKAIHEAGYRGYLALECGISQGTTLEQALKYLRNECLAWS